MGGYIIRLPFWEGALHNLFTLLGYFCSRADEVTFSNSHPPTPAGIGAGESFTPQSLWDQRHHLAECYSLCPTCFRKSAIQL